VDSMLMQRVRLQPLTLYFAQLESIPQS